jgi:hypothetical protein
MNTPTAVSISHAANTTSRRLHGRLPVTVEIVRPKTAEIPSGGTGAVGCPIGLPQNGQKAASSAWKPPQWMQYGTRRIYQPPRSPPVTLSGGPRRTSVPAMMSCSACLRSVQMIIR